jgi:iron(III) transport system substrate-binding protein
MYGKIVALASVVSLGLALGGAPALAEESFASPELIAAAKAEGKMVLYTANFAEVEQDVIRNSTGVSRRSRSRWCARRAAS